MTPALLCAGLEIGLNRYLRLEPEVLAQCATLTGRVIALRVESPPWTVFIELCSDGVRVLPELEKAADVSVSGPLSLLLRLAFKSAAGESGLPTGLNVQGDTELLGEFNRLLARVGFDPEEIAAKFFGDAAAHRLTQGLSKFFGWGRQTADTLALDTSEYLREETRDLAKREDVEDWASAVEQLREGADRLEARLNLLETAR